MAPDSVCRDRQRTTPVTVDPPKGKRRDVSDGRCIYYAINAVTRLTKTDVREKPVEEMDIEKTRFKVLELLKEKK